MVSKNFLTYQWALELYKEVEKIKASYAIKDQLTRASLSVVLNVAEGSGRWSLKDQTRFFRIALASLREVEALLDILNSTTKFELRCRLGASLVKLSSRA